MNLQPKTRKYRLHFRNKTRIHNKKPFDFCIRKLKKKVCFQGSRWLAQIGNQPAFNLFKTQSQQKSFIQPYNFSSYFKTIVNCQPVRQPVHESSYTDRVSQIQLVTKGVAEHWRCISKPNVLNNAILTTKGIPTRNLLSLANNSKSVGYVTSKPKVKSLLYQEVKIATNATHDLQQKIDCLSINSQIDAPSLLLSNTDFSEKCSGAIIDKIRFGDRGFYFCNWGTITAKFIETTRLLIARRLKKAGRFWIRICPDTPVTQRSAETRMGRGKGAISHYQAKIRPGQIFIEFSGVGQENLDEIYKQLCKKTPIKIKYI